MVNSNIFLHVCHELFRLHDVAKLFCQQKLFLPWKNQPAKTCQH